MAITTAEAFLAVLEKSELLTTEQFAEAQDATLLTSYASELAEMLIQQEMITPWQATQLLAGRSSLFLGNYALMDLLGRGGMGSVFLARHRTMKRRVALKVVSKQVGKDPASLERFLAEARLIASLDHPNIVQAYDVDKESDRFYIVMEYIEGQDLEVIVQEHGLFGFEEVADCIRQAADGLAHAHSRNLIHCDIKPSNLLLSDQGVIKILDMGMARLTESSEDSGAQVDHKVLGTVDYMAPEQAMNSPDFDHRADIYSLGCTLYFLLTGRPPFDEGTLTQRIVKHQTQPPPDILTAHPDTPQELVDICMKMMAKNPADRYQTAAEVSNLLTDWHEPVHTPQTDNGHPQGSDSRTDQSEHNLATADLATAPSSTNLAIEELKQPGAVVAGPALDSKQKKTAWSEEQQTVILVAAAVFFAIVVLGIAVLIMIFRSPQTVIREIPEAQTKQIESSTDDADKPKPEPVPKKTTTKSDTPETTPKPPPPSPKKQTKPVTKKASDTSKKSKKPSFDLSNLWPTSPKTTPSKTPKAKSKKTKPGTPKPVDPFGELPAAIDLELLPDTVRQPQSDPHPAFQLAKLSPKDNSTLKIELVGGATALPYGDRFLLRPIENKNTEPTWMLRLDRSKTVSRLNGNTSSAANAQVSADVARIWFGQGRLMFEWLGEAIAESANYLKNCALDITIDGKTKTLALSHPRVVEPLVANLTIGTATQVLSEAYLPNASHLQLVVTGMESQAIGGRKKVNIVIEARERVDIDVPVPNLKRAVVRVSYVVKSGKSSVELECWCQLNEGNRMFKLRKAEWEKLDRALAEAPKRLEKLKSTNSALARKKLKVIESRMAEAKALLLLKDVVDGKGKLFFREYIVDNDRRIELTTTDAPPGKKDGSK
ncbi:MAG: serine/threonine protein kinase [Pirellulales bacterium]|nr:serine/threonine protein kinase [Pirellulales bacterium]